MQRLQKFLAIIGATSLLVLGINGITEAANNSAMKIGKTNKGSKVTTIKRTKDGPAFAITTKNTDAAPFTTNATGVVANLNSSMVNGADLKTVMYRDSANQTGNKVYTVPVAAAGTYLVSISANVVPDGPASAASPNTMWCYFASTSGIFADTMLQANELYIDDYWASPSASGVLNLSQGNYYLHCGTSNSTGWTIPSLLGDGFGPTVTLTRIGSVATQEMD